MARPKIYVKKILITPFQRFIATESSGGIILIIFTILALLWANSPWQETYTTLWTNKLTIGYSDWQLSKPLLLWINDGLMCVFFFLVGLEIKREVLAGELSSFKQASLPFISALGGMLLPALVFILVQGDRPGSEGWGIPMATDIAFSLGILSLLGKRVPLSLKIFLTAFAIVDDIGAVLVIAIFYSAEINLQALIIGLGLFSILIIFNIAKVQSSIPYLIVGIVIWYFFLKSGLHPTIAGIMSAFTIPITARVRSSSFADEIESNLTEFKEQPDDPEERLLTYNQLSSAEAIQSTSKRVQPPLQKLEHSLHHLVAFFILPVFALANSGVLLENFGQALTSPLTISIAAGLLIGKTAGVGLFSWLGLKLKVAQLPGDFKFQHLLAVGMLGGVGFTMALFIANLAFTDPILLNQAKAGILLGSTIAGLGGYFWLKATLKNPTERLIK
jgi:NhaA family Na+:H+ antiporter